MKKTNTVKNNKLNKNIRKVSTEDIDALTRRLVALEDAFSEHLRCDESESTQKYIEDEESFTPDINDLKLFVVGPFHREDGHSIAFRIFEKLS
jgi:hypothetical protein